MSFKEIFDAIGNAIREIGELISRLGSFLWNSPWYFTVLLILTVVFGVALINSEDEQWSTRLLIAVFFLASGYGTISYWPSV